MLRIFNLSPHGDWNDQFADPLVRVRRPCWGKRFQFLRKPPFFPRPDSPRSHDRRGSRRPLGRMHLHILYLVFQLLVPNVLSINAGFDSLIRRILEVHSHEDFHI